MKKLKIEFLVLGAGWSGLLAAKLISQANRNVLILEKETQSGGLARTINHKGFKFDLGGHRLNFSNQENLELVRGILNQRLLYIKKSSKIFTQGKLLNYPPDIQSCFNFPPKIFFKIIYDYFRRNRVEKIVSLEDWVKANFGTTIYDIYFKDYTNKVWGLEGKDLSNQWAEKRIGPSSLLGLVKNLFARTEDSIETFSSFYYPEQGIGSLTDCLANDFKQQTGIFNGVEIKHVRNFDNKTAEVSFLKDGQMYEVSCEKIISTIPWVDLLSLLQFKQNGFEDQIRYRSLKLVNLIIDRPQIRAEHWCYYPDNSVIFSRMHEPKNWSKKMVPDKNKTSLCLEIFCGAKEELWSSPDELLFDKVKEQLAEMGLVEKTAIDDFFVESLKYAYPLYYLGCEKAISRVKDELGKIKSLVLLGRTGTHSYFDMSECIDNVRSTVASLLNNKK